MTATTSARQGFWNRPTLAKAVLLVLGYLVFFVAVSRLIAWVFSGAIDDDDPLADFSTLFFGLALPIAIGGTALFLFARWQGWAAEIFGRQPVEGRRWMWIAPMLVVLAIVAHVVGTEWSDWSAGQILGLALVGAAVGFTEEIATRGIVVTMLRDAGHGEKFVAFIASLLFALMHMTNLISGMAVTTVLATVVYTLGFGACMYLSMRVTGTIWAAIILHGFTDPTTFLAAGGLDKGVTEQAGGAAALAVLATVLVILVGIGSLFFVRGRARAAVS